MTLVLADWGFKIYGSRPHRSPGYVLLTSYGATQHTWDLTHELLFLNRWHALLKGTLVIVHKRRDD